MPKAWTVPSFQNPLPGTGGLWTLLNTERDGLRFTVVGKTMVTPKLFPHRTWEHISLCGKGGYAGMNQGDLEMKS